jgi:diguanylate cyclase (GGDEF)-like protein
MSWDGQLRGALSIGFSRMRRVSPADLRLLEAFADLASVACRNAEAFRSAAQLDALTGVLEHGALEAALARMLDADEEVGCVLVDLDDFHAVNEREGHRRGDDVLRRVAALLRRECGEEAPVGRFGGDQFAAATAGDASALAERVLRELAAELDLAASIGVATATKADGAAALLDRALAAAHAAKQAGGGRVTAAD